MSCHSLVLLCLYRSWHFELLGDIHRQHQSKCEENCHFSWFVHKHVVLAPSARIKVQMLPGRETAWPVYLKRYLPVEKFYPSTLNTALILLQNWPEEFHGLLYSSWGCKESDRTGRLSLSLSLSSETVLFQAWHCSASCCEGIYPQLGTWGQVLVFLFH